MKLDVLSETQAKRFIKEEVERKFQREFKLIWDHINKLREEIKILHEQIGR